MVDVDIAIRHGYLIDGSGEPRRRADVGIRGDRIVQIGQVGAARREIDASGAIVAPGFIDPHSHTDWTVHANRNAESTIRQGVTTEVVGNCGITNAPVSELSVNEVRARMLTYGYDGPVNWRSFAGYLSDLESGGTAQNLAFLVGHSTIREAAGVVGGNPSDEARRLMESSIREAMEAGAFGMSSGLEYSFGASASLNELRQLTGIVELYGGIYASHIRNRDAEILEAVDEFLSIVADSKVSGQISHLNVRHDTGAPNRAWERAVEKIVSARERGLDVEADATPFRQGVGIMTGVLPSWLIADGYGSAAIQLADPRIRQRLRDDCDRYWRFIHRGQWDRVRLQNSPHFPEFNGLTFPEISRRHGRDEWDSFFDILAASGENMGNLILVGDLFTEDHLAEIIAHPLFSLGVDAYSSIDHGPLSKLTASPLPYSGHVQYLTHHVRKRGTLTLEEAVRKMSSMPANRFRLRDRGLVKQGYFADLVVFDFDALSTESTFENPAVYPRGIPYVLVNGQFAVDCSEHTGCRAGTVLRRGSIPEK